MPVKLAHSALLFCFICSCDRHDTPHSAQIPSNVVEGVGIPGYVEIGMRMNSIAGKIPDATCEPNSCASLTWWCGNTWRKHPPWGKPATYELRIPSMGASAFETSPTNRISQIHFMAKKEYDWPYFSGTLSSGLSFSGTSTVSLAEVIARYGAPLHTLTYRPATNVASITNALQFQQHEEAILASGESLLTIYETAQPYRLHYPARGIYFDIQDRQVHSFRIFKKVEPNGPANGSQPIRSETNRTSSAAGSRR
jgi:hypothetical protein